MQKGAVTTHSQEIKRKESYNLLLRLVVPGCVRVSVRPFVRAYVRMCEKRKRKPHARAPG